MTIKSDLGGLLFDKDGTLFDFVASWAAATDDMLAALTSDPGRQAELAGMVGYDKGRGRFQPGSLAVAGAISEVAEIWADALGRPVWEIEDLVNSIADRAVMGGALCPAVPDLAAYLDGLRRAGFRLGIATHDSERAARAQMATVDALDHFDFIAGYDSGHGLKPGPGMLLAFAELTGLRPDQIVMIGDSIHDLGVGPSAGAAMAVGVLTGPAERADLEPFADHVLDSIADLPALLGVRI